VRAIRRYWREVVAEAGAREEEPVTRPLVQRVRPSRLSPHRLRRELPANTVRRWYAEALLLLESKGMVKPASSTPGEFLPVISKVYPECASGLNALTRAYENVRYGNRDVDPGTLDTLSIHHAMVMETIRKKARAEDDPGQTGQGDLRG
jgi:uncharacterized protein DUF4129